MLQIWMGNGECLLHEKHISMHDLLFDICFLYTGLCGHSTGTQTHGRFPKLNTVLAQGCMTFMHAHVQLASFWSQASSPAQPRTAGECPSWIWRSETATSAATGATIVSPRVTMIPLISRKLHALPYQL